MPIEMINKTIAFGGTIGNQMWTTKAWLALVRKQDQSGSLSSVADGVNWLQRALASTTTCRVDLDDFVVLVM